MAKPNIEIDKILTDRFGKDSLIALATSMNNVPSVRRVNAHYEDGAFYVITYAKSNKMKQIECSPCVAVAGEWFSGHGQAVNLGFFGKQENCEIAQKLRLAFAEWIDNGHNNFDDENIIILRIDLTDGVLFSNGVRYEF